MITAAFGQARRRLRPGVPSPRWVWIVPPLLLMTPTAALFLGLGLPKLIAGLIALVLIIPLSKRPAWCLLIAVPFVALQQVVLPLLWSYGLPGQVARQLGGVKDLLVLALILAAIRAIRASGRRLDVVDKLVLGYVAIVLLHLVVPQLFDPLIPANLTTRLLAFRYDAGYVLLFFGARHSAMPERTRERYVRMLLILGGIIVAGGLWQKVAPSNFADFILNTSHGVQFQVDVMNIRPGLATNSFAYLNSSPLQVGSFLVLPHYMADLLLVPFAFVLERLARGSAWRLSLILFSLIGLTLVFSQIRADLLAAVALVALVTIPRRGRTSAARVGLVVLILAAAVLAIPIIAGSRVTGGGNAATSNQGHRNEFSLAVQLMTHHPLGLGLGNNPATADRFQLPPDKTGALTGDNSLLQVGDELGVVALLVYTVFLVTLFASLIRRGRDDPFPNAALLAFTGVWIAGMFHHVFLSYPQAWALWGAVGLALQAGRQQDASNRPADELVQANSWA